MAPPDLVRLFESLVAPVSGPSGKELAALPIPAAETHRLGKDAACSPCLLIRQSSSASRSAPIRLENLVISFEVACTISQPGHGTEQGIFTIVRCVSSDPALQTHFLRIVAPTIVALGSSPTQAAVRRAIAGLVELFQALTAPATKTIQGLWAELLLIRRSLDPLAMVAAWHREPGEHFDFAAGPQRLEVKSTSSRRREHHFGLAQLSAIGGSKIIVASVFVERLGGGMSLQTLCDEIRSTLGHDPALAARFDMVLYKSLGSGWADAMDERFDNELAADSIAFYEAENIPRPENNNPHAVFDVRFRADLTSAAPLTSLQLQQFGGLFTTAATTTT